MNQIFLLCIVLILPVCVFSTLSKSDRKRTQNSKKISKVESLTPVSISNRHFPNTSVNFQDILDEHNSFSIAQSSSRKFHNDVLGYVTPWNNRGYDIAKLFSAKFTTISPVWLQLKPGRSVEHTIIDGLDGIDDLWISSLQKSNPNIKIIPRIIFEQWTYQSLLKLFQTKDAVADLTSKLSNLAKDKDFSGYVIEIWNMLGGQLKREVIKFLADVSKSLTSLNLDLILVIPPPIYFDGQKGTFSREDFFHLVNHVSAFSLMSYDYSNFYRPGPNSPLPWLIDCVNYLEPDVSSENRKKILLGLNFYGMEYSKSSSRALVGNEYLSILKKYKPEFSFDSGSGEHYFSYRAENMERIVYYPTLNSIQYRLQLAEEMGTGIAIWEIGQGLDYFYNLL